MTGPAVFEWDEPLPDMPEPAPAATAFPEPDDEPVNLPVLSLPERVDHDAREAVLSLTDPDRVLTFAQDTRRRVLGTVRSMYGEHKARRREGRLTDAHVAQELVFLTNAAECLDALADAIKAGAAEARSIAGDVIADVKLAEQGDDRIGTVSLKVGASDGSTIRAKRVQGSKLEADDDKIVDLLAAFIVGQGPPDSAQHRASGARAMAGKLRELASWTWRTSALDHLATQLEQQDEHDLAIRLRHSYGRRPHGDPKVTLEREPAKAVEAKP